MLAHTFERVGIEEAAAIESYTGDETIIKRTFEYVIIFGVTVEEEETVVDIHVADSSTSLAICRHIGKFVVCAECFTVACGTDTAGDIVFLAYNIIPDAVDGVDIGGVACESGDIRHTGIHISGTHGMTYSLILIDDRFVSL